MNENILIILFLWVVFSFAILLIEIDLKFKIGPNDNLILLGIKLNNIIKWQEDLRKS